MTHSQILFFALSVWIGGVAWSPAVCADAPLIAAAASVRPALEEISARYTQTTGESVRLVFGSSGTLVKQIANGAPYLLFLSANSDYVQWLADRGLTAGPPVAYADGVLALFARAGLLGERDNPMTGLGRAVENGTVKRLVIANPEYAPMAVQPGLL